MLAVATYNSVEIVVGDGEFLDSCIFFALSPRQRDDLGIISPRLLRENGLDKYLHVGNGMAQRTADAIDALLAGHAICRLGVRESPMAWFQTI